MSSNVDGSISRSGPPVAIPALATATSIPPSRRARSSTAAVSASRVAHVRDRGLRAGDDPAEAVGVDVDQPEAHAPGRELAGELGADARRAAGDERHAPVEVPGHRHGTLNGRVRFVTTMSLPGDENPNPQWQRREEEPKPQWTSGDPLGEQAGEPPAWQQQPQSEWQRQPRRNGSSRSSRPRSSTRAGSRRRARPARPTRR